MRGFVELAILSVLAPVLSFGQTSSLTQGVELFRQGKYEDALKHFKASERSQLPNAVIENLLGITETKLGNIDDANMHYKSAIRIAPSMAAPYKNLGFNDLNAKQYKAAEYELKTALALAPSDPFVHYYLAMLYLATSREQQATEQLGPAMSLVENDPVTAIQMIKACIQMNLIDESTSLIGSLEKRSEIFSAEEYQLATLMTAKHLYPEAVKRFQRMVEMQPQAWENQYNLAIALLNARQNTQATQLLQHLAIVRPKDANVFSLLGTAREAAGQLPQALEAYRTAVQLDPRNQDRYLDYSRLLLDMNRYDEASKLIQEGEKLTPDAYGLQLRLGVVQMLEGNYTAAQGSFQRSIDWHPEIVIGHIALAQAYMKQGNDAQAAQVLKDSQRLFPNDFMVEYFSGLVSSRLGQNKEALASMERAVQLAPNVVECHFELGKLLLRVNRIPEAQAQFESAIALDPEMARSYYELSRVYARLGEKTKAKQMAERSEKLMQTQRQAAIKSQMARLGGFHFKQ